ncbi:hypothetical protein [Amazonocrinis nigriterrae]|nr:hypothetical protein [Amazonocrinis nigriterrae]
MGNEKLRVWALASGMGEPLRWGDTALRGLRALKQVSSALPT